VKQVNILKMIVLGAGFGALVMSASCGGGVEGTYGDPNGAITIDLKSGGKATFIMMNQSQDCTYTVDKIIGAREIIIRPLSPLLAPLTLYAGATISVLR